MYLTGCHANKPGTSTKGPRHSERERESSIRPVCRRQRKSHAIVTQRMLIISASVSQHHRIGVCHTRAVLASFAKVMLSNESHCVHVKEGKLDPRPASFRVTLSRLLASCDRSQPVCCCIYRWRRLGSTGRSGSERTKCLSTFSFLQSGVWSGVSPHDFTSDSLDHVHETIGC